MEFLEKDLEDIIFNADNFDLFDRGLNINGKLLRQLKIGNYGRCDLLEFNRPYYHDGANELLKGCITIYELKQNEINVGTFLQALGYLKGVRRYLELRGMENYFNYQIVLIGKKIDTSNFVYLADFLNKKDIELPIYQESFMNLQLFTYSYNIDGLYFKNIKDYKLKDEKFNIK